MSWERVCDVLERLSTCSVAARRRVLLRSLLDDARASGDPFSVMRILLPKRDRIRPQYQLKETGLAACLVNALGLAPSSFDGSRLLSWRTTADSFSGDLSRLTFEVISSRQRQEPGNLSVANLHCHLDKLSSSSTREGKTSVLRDLIKQTTPQQMKWIVRVILQDMRIGLGEKTILNAFHPEADALMSFCVDLHQVCTQLVSPSARFCHQDLVVGKALKCQHSKRTSSIDEAWDLMRGKNMVAECKFDGDRMQLHKDGDTLYFWSRNGLEHVEYNVAIGPILQQHITPNRCVLDGELLVWNCFEERYKPRTRNLNRDAARAARKGWVRDDLVCYVVFDILYEEEHGSLLHLPLSDRHALLKKSVNQCHPRLISILPDDDGSEWSVKPRGREDLVQFFNEVVHRGDEGIILKDLESQWGPDNQDGRWCKIKPDYLSLGSDLDLLIIGGYYGRGQRGGQIASYLLAVKDQPENDVIPSRFLSICRCGVGLSDSEHAMLQRILAPHFVKNTKMGMVPANSGYLVTNSQFERPDVWIASPKLSVVLQVCAEKRVYASHTFKAGWTFRFPRAEKIREDKDWHDCLSIQEFEEMVASANRHGNSLVEKCEVLPTADKMKQKKRKTHRSDKVPTYLQGCNVSHIIQQTSQFQKLIFYICNSGQNKMTQRLHAQIKEAGGTTALNLEACVTHVISSQPKGMHYKAAVTSGRDVISMDWLQDCLNSTQLLPITFRHYLHMSDATKEKQKEEVDVFGDPYADFVTPEDLGQIFQKMKGYGQDKHVDNADEISKMEAKILEPWQWGIFRKMSLYMLRPIHSTNKDSQIVAQIILQRLSLEASMYGATSIQSLSKDVTHVVCYAPLDVKMPFKSIIQSVRECDQNQILQDSGVNVVSHLWLQDSLQQKIALPPAAYNLRDEFVEEHSIGKNVQVLHPKRRRVCQVNVDDITEVAKEPFHDSKLDNKVQVAKEQFHDSMQDSIDEFLRILIPDFSF